MSHDAFHTGLELLSSLQRKLEYPPKRHLIKDYVHKLIKEADLRDDSRRRYFELLATCALMGREPLHNSFKPRRKHAKGNRS